MTEELDISDTTQAKSLQLVADDLLGNPRTIKITKVSRVEESKSLIINYEGENGKPFLPSKTVRRIMQHIWTKNAATWVGKEMTLFRDPDVIWAGQIVGGVRVSHMSHMDKPVTISLTMNSKSKKPFTIKPLITKGIKKEIEHNKETAQHEEATIAEKVAAKVFNDAFSLEEDGKKYAGLGVSSYKNWLAGLTPNQKESIKQHHAEWSKIAKDVDG